MSFSANVKEELSKINIFSNEEVVKAEIYGYMLTTDTSMGKIKFLTENEYNINRLNKLLNRLKIKYNIKMCGKNYEITLKKNDLNLEKISFENLDIAKGIVRGTFLGGGSITEPNTRYHLEIRLETEKAREEIRKLIDKFNIKVKLLDRKYSYSIYIKDGEEISKFLALIGANSSVLRYEDIRVLKETKNNVNRKVNCETANLNKTINAAVAQIHAIEKIKKRKKWNNLPPNLQEVAKLRVENPDATLEELGKMLTDPIGKSGVNHRLKRIIEISEE